MQILFLDIDGVLNNDRLFQSEPAIATNNDHETMLGMLDSDCVWNLGYLLQKVPDLKVVIHSTWRKMWDWEKIAEAICAACACIDRGRFIGATPWKFSSEKCHEIPWWLAAHPEAAKYVVLDDDILFSLENPCHRHQVRTSCVHGLTIDDADEVVRRFTI